MKKLILITFLLSSTIFGQLLNQSQINGLPDSLLKKIDLQHIKSRPAEAVPTAGDSLILLKGGILKLTDVGDLPGGSSDSSWQSITVETINPQDTLVKVDGLFAVEGESTSDDEGTLEIMSLRRPLTFGVSFPQAIGFYLGNYQTNFATPWTAFDLYLKSSASTDYIANKFLTRWRDDGLTGFGTKDFDGTPAYGTYTFQSNGKTNASNAIVIRDSDSTNIFIINDLGEVTLGKYLRVFFITGNNAPSTATTERELSLVRRTTGGVSNPNVADFRLGRYNNSGTSPYTQLDIYLKSVNNPTDTAEVKIMTLRADKKVYLPGSMTVGDSTTGDNDGYYYFADDGNLQAEYLKWDDGDDEFQLSDDIDVAGRAEVDDFRLVSPTVPSTAADTGTAGDIAWDSDYIYICVAANTWKRVAISTW